MQTMRPISILLSIIFLARIAYVVGQSVSQARTNELINNMINAYGWSTVQEKSMKMF